MMQNERLKFVSKRVSWENEFNERKSDGTEKGHRIMDWVLSQRQSIGFPNI